MSLLQMTSVPTRKIPSEITPKVLKKLTAENEMENKNTVAEEGVKLFVQGFDKNTNWRKIKEIFSRCGMVDYVKTPEKNYSFVSMADQAGAAAAIRDLHGQPFSGQKLKVAYACGMREVSEAKGKKRSRVKALATPTSSSLASPIKKMPALIKTDDPALDRFLHASRAARGKKRNKFKPYTPTTSSWSSPVKNGPSCTETMLKVSDAQVNKR
jgi:RNA recognition motif-containing protein